jgi:hypothetical protein
MVAEIVVAAVGALASLGAGLFKQYSTKKARQSDRVTVTVQRGNETIELQGIMRPDESSRVLDMVHAHPSHAQPSSVK